MMTPVPKTTFRTIVIVLLGTIVTILVVGFIVFQARYLLLGPQITLTEPPSLLQNERRVTITGTARNLSHLWLNDRPIYTDQTGTFREDIILENGYTRVTLRAEDRYGRSAILEQPFMYSPASFVQ